MANSHGRVFFRHEMKETVEDPQKQGNSKEVCLYTFFQGDH